MTEVCHLCCYTRVLFILDALRSDCIHLYALLVFIGPESDHCLPL